MNLIFGSNCNFQVKLLLAEEKYWKSTKTNKFEKYKEKL